MSSAVVLGSAGFIGSNLVEECLKRGWKVLGIDNFATSGRNMADPSRVNNLGGDYSFVEADICDRQKLDKLFKGYDVVFHMAALPRVQFSVDNPIESNRVNVGGTLSVLDAARSSCVKRVVFSCSSSIFGGSEKFPTKEDTVPKPLSPYALQKLVGAQYCKMFSNLYGLDTCNLVYYNVIGKYQSANSSYSTVVPAFFDAGISGKVCRIDGNGNQSRDFTHVINVVHANILAAEYNGKLNGDLFNIANGESHSVNDIFDLVQKYLGVGLKKRHAPARLGDPYKSHADISKAQLVLGYSPIVGFEKGIELTANWWKDGCRIE